LFLFSSRRRHTRSKRDWSSDVCSSDLLGNTAARVLGDELQHLDLRLGNAHVCAGSAHQAARGGEEVEDAGRDFGDVDVREDFLRLVPADVGLGALGGGRCATHYCSSLLVLVSCMRQGAVRWVETFLYVAS